MIREEIRKLIQEVLPEETTIEIERIENKSFGDYSINAAFKIAKTFKKNPMEAAEIIVAKCKSSDTDLFVKIEISQPGFINFFLSEKYLQKQVEAIWEKGKKYGEVNFGQNQKVQVEFISANPTGPLTLGNARGGFFGDVLASVLQKAGYQTEREFYINDAGEQVVKLGHSVLNDEQAVYQGEYINELREQINVKNKSATEIGQEAANLILENMLKPAVAKMRIEFDHWFAESSLHQHNKVQKVIELLKAKNLTYEEGGALWFKSTQFGDDKDRVLTKKDGQTTYLAADAAYHFNKFQERGFDRVINIWGADHHGDVARLKAIVEILGFKNQLDIILLQFVRLMKKGEEKRMSKRAGVYVTVEELIDEVGLDVAKFFFLMRSPDSHLNFDLSLAKEQSEKNPVYYVQYAYARICSILRKAQEDGVLPLGRDWSPTKVGTPKLTYSSELDLIKQLIRLPEIIEDIAKDYQVQRLPQYALDLVRAFHKFYEECRVISEDKNLTQARLGLVKATQIVLKNILDLMGLSAPEKM